MMSQRLPAFFLTSVILAGIIRPGDATVTYYMDDYCGSQITVCESIFLKLTSSPNYEPDMKCVVTVYSSGLYMNAVMARVLWTEIEGNQYSCRNDRLIIYDGSSAESYDPKLTGPNGLCGYSSTPKTYRSSGSWMTFNFTSDSSVEGAGFKILINGFDKSGVCVDGEYECDNGYCVDTDLECDGQNNCGDNSDETNCDFTVGGIVGITIGCVSGAILLAAIVIIVAARGSRRTNTRARVAQSENSYLVNNAYPPYTVNGQMAPPAYNTMFPNGQSYTNVYAGAPPAYGVSQTAVAQTQPAPQKTTSDPSQETNANKLAN